MRLISEFGLDLKKKIYKLSKGMTSMLTIVLALASKAPITMLDEPVAGLDVVMRERFYELLLEDYEETGRSFLISTHIIEEAAKILEEVILIHKGTVLEKKNTEDFLSEFYTVSGHNAEVEQAVAGMQVLHREHMGRHESVCIRTKDSAQVSALAKQYEVTLAPVSLQKAFIYVTEDKPAEGKV